MSTVDRTDRRDRGADPSDREQRGSAVGFLGLGTVGAFLAAQVLATGRKVVVHDPTAARAASLALAGAEVVEAPAEVARRTAAAIVTFDSASETEAAVLGHRGWSLAAEPGDLLIVMGTIEAGSLQRMHAALAARDIDLIDAPVSGMRGIGPGRAAALKCYVGGAAGAVERARPLLEAMTAGFTCFGGIGSGTAMKVVNGMLAQVNRVVIAEALALGAKAGLDPAQMVETVLDGRGDSVAFRSNAPRMLARDFEGIALDITLRDIELQVALAQSLGMPMFMAPMALQVHQVAQAMGLGDRDAAAVVQVYEQWTGVPIGTAMLAV